jgi:hypothetical protein
MVTSPNLKMQHFSTLEEGCNSSIGFALAYFNIIFVMSMVTSPNLKMQYFVTLEVGFNSSIGIGLADFHSII